MDRLLSRDAFLISGWLAIALLAYSGGVSAQNPNATAGSPPSCHEQKVEAASRYHACLVRARFESVDDDRCRTQFFAAFERAERHEPGCEPLDDLLLTERRVRNQVEELVGGSASPPPCDEILHSGDLITCRLTPTPQTSATVDSANLAAVLVQIQGNSAECSRCAEVDEDTVLWIEAWGGSGGAAWADSVSVGAGGIGGYAQMVTTVSDLAEMGISDLYFYLGGSGRARDTQGGQGGASTLVTRRDLTLSPGTPPSLDETLLLAGGGGGVGGYDKDCLIGFEWPYGGGSGGLAISTLGAAAMGAGDPDESGHAHGGSQGVGGGGGHDGIGGMGGGSGAGAGSPNSPPSGWVNTNSTPLTFTAGSGAPGASTTNTCTSGGGAGGGGWGGGGGGSHGNAYAAAQGGGGGGSYAAPSTRSDANAPTSPPDNPNTVSLGSPRLSGFVQLVFDLDPL